MIKSRYLVLALVLFGSARAIRAAEPPDAARVAIQRDAMDPLLVMWTGNWLGSGWAHVGPGERREFTMTETVAPRLQGLLLLVEGQGTSQDPVTGDTIRSHDALAVVTYDPDREQYRFRHYTMDGRTGEAELVRTDTGFRWGFHDDRRGGDVRFTIALDGDRWHEIGEFSRDGGATWFTFLEMGLER